MVAEGLPFEVSTGELLPDGKEERVPFQVLSDAAGKLYPQVGFIKIAGEQKDTQPTPITKKEEVTNE